MTNSNYKIGVARVAFDMSKFMGRTLMGYNSNDQIADGQDSTLFARAFVVSDDKTTIALVVADIWACTGAIRRKVLELVDAGQIGSQIPHDAIMISATHTHAGPSGISDHRLFSLMTGGYSQSVVDEIAGKIHQALVEALHARVPGGIRQISARADPDKALWGGQRSNAAYQANTAENKDQINWENLFNINMLHLYREESSQYTLGIIAWLPVHNTAFGNTNTKLSGDIFGKAADIIERESTALIPDDYKWTVKPGEIPVVAGLINAASGDISPKMVRDGEGWKRRDVPSETALKDTLGTQIAKAVMSAWAPDAVTCDTHHAPIAVPIVGPLKFALVDKDMTSWNGKTNPWVADRDPNKNYPRVKYPQETQQDVQTYTGALGLSTFAGSSADGPGPMGLREGIRDDDMQTDERVIQAALLMMSQRANASDILSFVGLTVGPALALVALVAAVPPLGLLVTVLGGFGVTAAVASAVVLIVKDVKSMQAEPLDVGADYVDGHKPKPITLRTAKIGPSVLPVQLIRIADVSMVGFPGEITTLAGRHIQLAVVNGAANGGAAVGFVNINSCTNAYSQYVTTPEEYDTQHYEGASTVFGPNTMDAYAAHFYELSKSMG
ncbi:neutral/alkaline non-lysosomal ceramidase N-terminal domain-containing protein [Ruegeria sp. PrR005]|uniref:Neutral ceramidase n=1 Tax=Ruegeria sp. PrR005 TaxID=2706882 RepID=A0A6B2NT22_9RHOB|nr:neutral/alkaline non-lysosomal ceramidase N-terminal domain-containing protein [Ruegeria sp. PrR005]NDW45564.1 hypothetical protein [Ruegeria sp. PrR005]